MSTAQLCLRQVAAGLIRQFNLAFWSNSIVSIAYARPSVELFTRARACVSLLAFDLEYHRRLIEIVQRAEFHSLFGHFSVVDVRSVSVGRKVHESELRMKVHAHATHFAEPQ